MEAIVSKALANAKRRTAWSRVDGENLRRALRSFTANIDAVMVHYLENCLGCKSCARSCPYYEPTHISPSSKAENARMIYRKLMTYSGRLLGRLVAARIPREESEVREVIEAAYYCVDCGHCYVTCPMGIDSGAIIHRLLRPLAAEMGKTPTLVELLAELEYTGDFVEVSPFSKYWNEVLEQAEAVIGRKLPYDKANADVLLLPMLYDVIHTPGAVVGAIKILEAAGLNYTLPSKPLGIRVPIAALIGRYDMARKAIARVVETAEKLRVKTVVLLDGGYPYPWLRWHATEVLGRRINFKVLHIVELLDDLLSSGKLNASRRSDRITWHDPCQLARRGGVTIEPYRVLPKIASEVVLLKHRGADTVCCGAGGVLDFTDFKTIKFYSKLLNVPAAELVSGDLEKDIIRRLEDAKNKASERRVREIVEANASTLVTACPSCIRLFSDKLREHNIRVLHIAEYVAGLISRESEIQAEK